MAEAKKQLDGKEVYQKRRKDVEVPLDKVIKKVIRKLRNRGSFCHETLHNFSVNNPEDFIYSLRSINGFIHKLGILLRKLFFLY